jgi:hypothetical protein
MSLDLLTTMQDEAKSVEVQVTRDQLDHFEFVQRLINMAEDHERLNYQSYMRALREGLLNGHQGRWIYISKVSSS